MPENLYLKLKLSTNTGDIHTLTNAPYSEIKLHGSSALPDTYKLMSVQLNFTQTSIVQNNYEWINTDFTTDSWVDQIDSSGVFGDNLFIANTTTYGNRVDLSGKVLSLFKVTRPYNAQSGSPSFLPYNVSIDQTSANTQIAIFDTSTNNILIYRPTSSEYNLEIEYE